MVLPRTAQSLARFFHGCAGYWRNVDQDRRGRGHTGAPANMVAVERWNVGHRIRDVEVGPDGALWLLEDSSSGGLFRVTPK
jgi:glucose/arabinose dehydrogenase